VRVDRDDGVALWEKRTNGPVAELAATGAPVGRPLVIALVALLCGLTMVASARRRRGTQP